VAGAAVVAARAASGITEGGADRHRERQKGVFHNPVPAYKPCPSRDVDYRQASPARPRSVGGEDSGEGNPVATDPLPLGAAAHLLRRIPQRG
jgi:hypothetical protein